MPSSALRSLNSLDSNCLPWSVMILSGTPKNCTQPLMNAFVQWSAVACSMGMAAGQRVNRSTMVRQYWYPWDGGYGPMMSMCRTWKRAFGGVGLIRGEIVWRWTFDRWHGMHSRTKVLMSLSMLGQAKLSFTSRIVAAIPGCDLDVRAQ